MILPPSPKKESGSYFELAILLAAGITFGIGITWVIDLFPKIFPGVKVSLTQELVLAVSPTIIGIIKWGADRLKLLRKIVDQNSLQLFEQGKQLKERDKQLEELKEEQRKQLDELKETIQRLDKEGIWSKIQIENLYSRMED